MKWVGCRHHGLLRGIRILVPHCKTTSALYLHIVWIQESPRINVASRGCLSKMTPCAITLAPPICDWASKDTFLLSNIYIFCPSFSRNFVAYEWNNIYTIPIIEDIWIVIRKQYPTSYYTFCSNVILRAIIIFYNLSFYLFHSKIEDNLRNRYQFF